MANQDRVMKLQELMIKVLFIRKGLEKERDINKKPDKAEQLKQEVIEIAKEVDKILGIVGQVEQDVIEGFSKYTIQKKMGINNQIRCIIERIHEAIEILSK